MPKRRTDLVRQILHSACGSVQDDTNGSVPLDDKDVFVQDDRVKFMTRHVVGLGINPSGTTKLKPYTFPDEPVWTGISSDTERMSVKPSWRVQTSSSLAVLDFGFPKPWPPVAS